MMPGTTFSDASTSRGSDLDRQRTFYTCLYRSTLFPHKLYEIDAEGNPVHYSPYNGEVLPGYMYTGTGFWEHSAHSSRCSTLYIPLSRKEMQEGFLNAYRERILPPNGRRPVIADA